MDERLKRDGESNWTECNDDDNRIAVDEALNEVMQALQFDRNVMENEMAEHEEWKTDQALINGVRSGRKQAVRYRRKKAGLWTVLAAASVFVLLSAFVRVSPSFASFLEDIPGFSGYVKLLGYDQSLMAAIDNEYLMPLNLSDERNGYKLTVNGLMADAQRAIILYSAEGPGIQPGDSLTYKLTDENGERLQAMIGSNHNFREVSVGKAESYQDYMDIMMGQDVPMPNQIHFQLELGGETLAVDVPIDQEQFADKTEYVLLNKQIEIGEQHILMKDVTITPLQVSVTFEGDEANSRRLNDFINMKIVDDKGREYTTPNGMGGLDSVITRNFQSSYFQKPRHLTFVADGALISDRDNKLVINSDTGDILSAPDSKIKLNHAEKKSDYIELELTLDQSDDPGIGKKIYTLFQTDSTFHDASGEQFAFLRFGGTQAGFRAGSSEINYFYRIPNKPYQQPLTFEIEEYPGYVMKEIKVEIK
ncbi:DUF4179 domain-containing protein [Paenibacillus sp. HB172176]|uniref:DUF4179 domain-containing protein n=1 Tax=Paenibacillus sp. HB172176 TaxID=2493690 RepID=UPI00143BE6CB|nr:DUF4179 domain-containing protein [Paenibacillus sp. HB172176]